MKTTDTDLQTLSEDLLEAELMKQHAFSAKVADYYILKHGEFVTPLAYVRTFGCQQNIADSEKIKGMLAKMGFGFTTNTEDAHVILFNTCAVRENAHDRVFGNVGALKSIKLRRPDVVIALCGCMVQQEHVADKLRESYPFVSMVFGTHVMHRLPEFLYKTLSSGKRLYDISDSDGVIVEDITAQRDGTFKAFVPIMYGCNNFCTYCVVPYVRGRERSRHPDNVLEEISGLVQNGYKEITLLGQNVNSFGRDADFEMDFPELLEKINAIDGEFIIRFMTSHPKDATKKLIDTIARCEKIERHFHLPFQSGSNRVLMAMNRGYTKEQYLNLVKYAREKIEGITFTSDVIVGFPGETREDFDETLKIIDEVGFASLFTFIYSPRENTPAAKMDDFVPAEEKSKWFREMLAFQESFSARQLGKMIDTVHRALVESDHGEYLEAKLSENIFVRVVGEKNLVGNFANVKITQSRNWILLGEII